MHFFLCLQRFAFLLYLSPQLGHMYGFSPVWMVSWSFLSEVCENFLVHGGWRHSYLLDS